ncbi:MAG: methylmalonyl-CoA mutase family protein, partial [Ginsengibacter sp.]
VGVNSFISDNEISPPSFKIDDNIRMVQINKIKALKEKREDAKVVSCLKKIKDHAANNQNLMPVVIDAVENLCTLGEISDTLRNVFGEFK